MEQKFWTVGKAAFSSGLAFCENLVALPLFATVERARGSSKAAFREQQKDGLVIALRPRMQTPGTFGSSSFLSFAQRLSNYTLLIDNPHQRRHRPHSFAE